MYSVDFVSRRSQTLQTGHKSAAWDWHTHISAARLNVPPFMVLYQDCQRAHTHTFTSSACKWTYVCNSPANRLCTSLESSWGPAVILGTPELSPAAPPSSVDSPSPALQHAGHSPPPLVVSDSAVALTHGHVAAGGLAPLINMNVWLLHCTYTYTGNMLYYSVFTPQSPTVKS